MRIMPVYSIGLFNLWLSVLLFALPILLTISIRGRIFKKTSRAFKSSRSSREFRIFLAAKIYMLFYFIYSVFIPVRLNTVLSIAGLAVYTTGFIIYSSAWVVIASTMDGQLFTRGPFKYSRHPVYLSAMVMFLGAGMISDSVIFLVLSFITGLTHMQNAFNEERMCLEIFTDKYIKYTENTHRWFGRINKNHKKCKHN